MTMKRIGALITSGLALSLSAATTTAPATPAAAQPVAATAADIKPGAVLRDVNSAPVGTIVSGTDQQVVVDTGQTRIGVPLSLLKRDDKGLLLGVTARQFTDAIARAHARAQAQQQQPQAPQPQQSH